MPPSISSADTAWLLISTALVLMMTPALGFFYGGMVRAKNALNTLMMSFSALGFVGLAWAFFGYSVAFGHASRWCGGGQYFFLRGVGLSAQGSIPHVLFFSYQGTFAIITAALISGAIVERMRFGPYLAFVALWSLVVYAPVAHWVWGGGWLAKLGALDFAGGTVVHINAGAAALVAAMVLGPRKDYGRQAILPHSVPFTVLGAGLLWFGWFGFNAGSALGANPSAGGTVGALRTGVLAQKVWNGATDGALFGNPKQLGIQAVAVVASIVYSAVLTWGLLKAIGAVVALRSTAPDEGLGLDVSQHG